MWRLLTILLFVAVAVPAHAQTSDSDEARQLANEGADLYEAGKYAQALKKLRAAEARMLVPTIVLFTSRTLDKLDRLKEAEASYARAAALTIDPALPPEFQRVQHAAQQTAREEREALLRVIPKLELRVQGDTPDRIVVDGAELTTALPASITVNPGRHVVEASSGDRLWSLEVTVARGEKRALRIQLPPPSTTPRAHDPPPRSPSPLPPPVEPRDEPTDLSPFGWVGVGVGGALIVVSLTTFGVASSKKSDLDGICPDMVCRESQVGRGVEEQINSYDAFRTTSLVTGIAGGVVAAAGIGLLLWPTDAGDTQMTLGPGGMYIRGRF